MSSTAKQTTTPSKNKNFLNSTKRKRSFRLTDRDKGMVVALFLDGYRPSEIATNMDRAYITIATVITNAGYVPERYKYTEAEAIRWSAVYLGEGFNTKSSVREIAEAFSVPHSRVQSALLRQGTRMRHPALAIRLAAAKRKKLKKNRKSRR